MANYLSIVIFFVFYQHQCIFKTLAFSFKNKNIGQIFRFLSGNENYDKHGIQIVQSNLNENIKLECPKNYLIEILDASFGNPTITVFSLIKNTEDAPQSTEIVKDICQNKNFCNINNSFVTFKAQEKDFSGLVNLGIKYVCVLKELKHIPTTSDNMNVKKSHGAWLLEYGKKEEINDQYYNNSFIHLLNFEGNCDKPLEKLDSYASKSEIEEKCSKIKNCNFIIFTSNSAILCESPSYSSPKQQIGSSIYVKTAQVVGSSINDFDISANFQGICEAKNIIQEFNPVYSPEIAAEKCKNLKECNFFVLSTVNRIIGANKSYINHLWLCSGDVVKVPHAGFITGARNTILRKNNNIFTDGPIEEATTVSII